MVQLVEHHPYMKKLPIGFLVRAHARTVDPIPSREYAGDPDRESNPKPLGVWDELQPTEPLAHG